MDGARGSFDVDARDYAGSPSSPNVDDLDLDAPTSPTTPIPAPAKQTGTGQVLSAITSIFSSSVSNGTPRQSVVVNETAPPPSSFKSPNDAHRSSAEVSADTTDSQDDFQSADEGHRSTSPPSSEEDEEENDEGFNSEDETLNHNERRNETIGEGPGPPPPRSARAKYIRPPSTTAFGIPPPQPLPQHGREESEMSSSTSGETEADRTLASSNSAESVGSAKTAVRKKSIVGSGEEEVVVVVPELERIPKVVQ